MDAYCDNKYLTSEQFKILQGITICTQTLYKYMHWVVSAKKNSYFLYFMIYSSFTMDHMHVNYYVFFFMNKNSILYIHGKYRIPA